MKDTHNKGKIINVLLNSVLILVFFTLISGCNFIQSDISPIASVSETHDFDRRKELAILKAQPGHTVKIDALSVMVDGVLNTRNEGRRVIGVAPLVISEVKKLPSLTDKKFNNKTRENRSLLNQPENEQIEIYNFIIENPGNENQGFVLTSNDIRIGFILAIVENGNLEDNDHPFTDIFHSGLTKHIEDTIALYNDISLEETDAAIEKWYDTEPEARSLTSRWMGDDWVATGYVSDFKRVVSAQIKTEWDQEEPYDGYVHIERTAAQGAPEPDVRYSAGCGPVAAAQLVAYYGYISNTNQPNNFTINPGALSEVNWVKTSGYNFYNLTKQSKILGLSSSGATVTVKAEEAALRGQVAALMYQLGKTFNSDYTKKGVTNTTSSKMASGFRNVLGYKSDTTGFRSSTAYSESGSSFSITYKNSSKSWVIDQLSKSKPRPIIFLGQRIENNGEKKGHFWLVDGYGTLSYYTEYLRNTITGQTDTYQLYLNNSIMVHCNLGWDGYKDGWYIYGLFDTEHESLIPRNILSIGIDDYSYDVSMFAPYC